MPIMTTNNDNGPTNQHHIVGSKANILVAEQFQKDNNPILCVHESGPVC